MIYIHFIQSAQVHHLHGNSHQFSSLMYKTAMRAQSPGPGRSPLIPLVERPLLTYQLRVFVLPVMQTSGVSSLPSLSMKQPAELLVSLAPPSEPFDEPPFQPDGLL
jgi:hypothetical protein